MILRIVEHFFKGSGIELPVLCVKKHNFFKGPAHIVNALFWNVFQSFPGSFGPLDRIGVKGAAYGGRRTPSNSQNSKNGSWDSERHRERGVYNI